MAQFYILHTWLYYTHFYYTHYTQMALLAAIRGNHVDCVRLILPVAHINEGDEEGKTPLHYAVSLGFINIVEMLLNDDRLDINRQDNNGKNALHYAVESNQLACLDLLLKR